MNVTGCPFCNKTPPTPTPEASHSMVISVWGSKYLRVTVFVSWSLNALSYVAFHVNSVFLLLSSQSVLVTSESLGIYRLRY